MKNEALDIQTVFGEIADLIQNSRKAIVSSVNSTMVMTYWNIGRIIVEYEQKGEKRSQYGTQQLKKLSEKLVAEFGKGYNDRNLRYMRRFYLYFPKWNALSSKLSWTHYRTLLKVDDQQARLWYMNEAADENWSTRVLERQINSLYYNRLLSSKNKKPVIKEAIAHKKTMQPEEVLKDPYVLEFLQLKNRTAYTENELESALIEHIQEFLLELGKGFSFVARQKRIDMDDEFFYIDLVFYNYLLKCFVLIDLKLGKLTHSDIGQMDSYIRIYEDKYRKEDDNPTIGLVLCSQKNEAIAKYSVLADSKQIFASKYKLILPSEKELARQLAQEVQEVKELMDNEK